MKVEMYLMITLCFAGVVAKKSYIAVGQHQQPPQTPSEKTKDMDMGEMTSVVTG